MWQPPSCLHRYTPVRPPIDNVRLVRTQVMNEFFSVSMACDNFNHFRQNIIDVQGGWGYQDAWRKMTLEFLGTFWTDFYFVARATGLLGQICQQGEKQPETCENFSLKCLAMMLDPKAQAAHVQVGGGEVPVLLKYDAKRCEASASSYGSPSERRPRYSCVSCIESRNEQWLAYGKRKPGAVQDCVVSQFSKVQDCSHHCSLCERDSRMKRTIDGAGAILTPRWAIHPPTSKDYSKCWNDHLLHYHPAHLTAGEATLQPALKKAKHSLRIEK